MTQPCCVRDNQDRCVTVSSLNCYKAPIASRLRWGKRHVTGQQRGPRAADEHPPDLARLSLPRFQQHGIGSITSDRLGRTGGSSTRPTFTPAIPFLSRPLPQLPVPRTPHLA